MFAFAPINASGRLARTSAILAGLLCAGAALGAQGAASQDASIPNLGSADFGWLKPPGDEFIVPESGPGPVRADAAHPYVSNALAPRKRSRLQMSRTLSCSPGQRSR